MKSISQIDGHFYEFDLHGTIENIISKEEIIDIIDFFYRWEDSKFKIYAPIKNVKWNGLHLYNKISRTHEIGLNERTIREAFAKNSKIGGNIRTNSLKMAVAMTLVHEIQHANQSKLHKRGEIFYTTSKYRSRACEREARQFVDENVNILKEIIEV